MIRNENLDTRLMIEEGVIIKKEYKKATEQFENEGRLIPAKPERFAITTLSAPVIDANMGCQTYNSNGELVAVNPIILDFEMPIEKKKDYEAIKFGDKVKVRYTYRNYNGKEMFKPLDFSKMA